MNTLSESAAKAAPSIDHGESVTLQGIPKLQVLAELSRAPMCMRDLHSLVFAERDASLIPQKGVSGEVLLENLPSPLKQDAFLPQTEAFEGMTLASAKAAPADHAEHVTLQGIPKLQVLAELSVAPMCVRYLHGIVFNGRDTSLIPQKGVSGEVLLANLPPPLKQVSLLTQPAADSFEEMTLSPTLRPR